MKAHLMFADKDFSVTAALGPGSDTLKADLELNRILECVGGGDDIVARAAASAMFHPLTALSELSYRHEVLKDCMENREAVRELYRLAVDADDYQSLNIKRVVMNPYLYDMYLGIQLMLKDQLDALQKLRAAMRKFQPSFRSAALSKLGLELDKLLPDDFFTEANQRLKELREKEGFLIAASLGDGLEGVRYALCRFNPGLEKLRWKLAPAITISEEDAVGKTDLEQRRDRAVNECVNILGQTAEFIARFFNQLRGELAFYIGCLNLEEKLTQLGMPVCLPAFSPMNSSNRAWKGMYDVSLALLKQAAVTANDLPRGSAKLTLITGANQGGKSTFLRSFGQAQLMAQSGMPVGAAELLVPLRQNLLTHFRKEEDSRMKKGKLDEELARMEKLMPRLQKGSVILFNESFAATNELEGSELCRQITQALVDAGVEVVIVSHQYTFAESCVGKPDNRLLCAERLASGQRTFRIVPGNPTSTAYGEDLYKKIFG